MEKIVNDIVKVIKTCNCPTRLLYTLNISLKIENQPHARRIESNEKGNSTGIKKSYYIMLYY